jgi:hypothetical protein
LTGKLKHSFTLDWIVLTKTQTQLRKVVKITNQVLTALKQTKHPDKTFIGRIQKGFNFLGYHFNGLTLRVARITIENALAKITQLYEEKASPNAGERLADYARRWRSWVRAGVPLTPGSLNANAAAWSQLDAKEHLHVAKLILAGMRLAT